MVAKSRLYTYRSTRTNFVWAHEIIGKNNFGWSRVYFLKVENVLVLSGLVERHRNNIKLFICICEA